ncbi:helix-turn-helix domain-containing protein [Pseudoalteromonas mariniglutinosa]|uniref:helix-turn-helix domain-containing protein n=1 Tax=Pseudoalteromonas mariniglutinosa TaxID=206042 RepID=UPI0009B691CC|nr:MULTISPECIES: helix-turn-helix domain-containing protein [Pseudoalteromonas]
MTSRLMKFQLPQLCRSIISFVYLTNNLASHHHQYVLNCRIIQARKYIESGLSTSRAALDAGFADNSHLNRHFKRVFGLTSTQYQRQLSR